VRAKIWGNLYALRGSIAAAVIIWTLAALAGALALGDYFTLLATTISAAVFITAVGVWISLTSSSATRAMTFTIGLWLVGASCVAAMAFMIVAVVALLILMIWLAVTQAVLMSGGKWSGPPSPLSFGAGLIITRVLLYLVGAFVIAAYCRYRFDKLAGRAGDQTG
jgi:hypothetical protein